MRRVARLCSAAILCLITLILALVLAFYVLIVFGASQTLQTVWICSAMRTMTHHDLAKAFFTDEKIEEVLRGNTVSDEGYGTESFTFTSKPSEDSYVIEGYRKLEDGIYLKDISDIAWRGHVMLVTDPMRVKLVSAESLFQSGETLTDMVHHAGAVAGINGGAFQNGEEGELEGAIPRGLLIEDGKLLCPEPGDDTEYHLIGLDQGGQLVLRTTTAGWAMTNGIVSATSFAPFLIVNGEGLVKTGTGGWGVAPRTAIGQRKSGEMLLLVIDGRSTRSIGCDLDAVMKVMQNENAWNAALLDGGHSTTMVWRGELLNRPSMGEERQINNAFVVMPSPAGNQ